MTHYNTHPPSDSDYGLTPGDISELQDALEANQGRGGDGQPYTDDDLTAPQEIEDAVNTALIAPGDYSRSKHLMHPAGMDEPGPICNTDIAAEREWDARRLRRVENRDWCKFCRYKAAYYYEL